ncbi:transmembrane protein 126A-like [Argonauta hians]
MQSIQGKGSVVRLSDLQDKPEGAILLSRQDVLKHQLHKIKQWQPASQMWPLTKGPGVCAAATVVSCTLTNHYFRRYFNLHHYGRAGGYVMAVAMPCVVGLIAHSTFITERCIIGDFHCPTCLMTRGGIIQALHGSVYPAILCPIYCLLQARKYLTKAIEPAHNMKDSIRLIVKTTIPFRGFLGLSVLANLCVGMFITHLEMDTFLNVLMKDQPAPKTEDLE